MNGKTVPHTKLANGIRQQKQAQKPEAIASLPSLSALGITNGGQKSSCTLPPEKRVSLVEMFQLIAGMRVCVVRRCGSDVDGQISAIIESACHSRRPTADGTVSPAASDVAVHFLTAEQQSAGQMLDCVRRKGLPLIFLNGDCIGGLAELKALDKSGFLVECLCPHQFDLVVIGGGGGGDNSADEDNVLAEQAVEEAVQLGKRVALIQLVSQNAQCRKQRRRIAREVVYQTGLMRTAIEEARDNGWTVEGDEGIRVSFWLDWARVREGIEQRECKERERVKDVFQRGKVQVFPALSCQFSGPHKVTVSPLLPSTAAAAQGQQHQQEGLLSLTADRFLLATRAEAKTLEQVPGAKEFCISNDELFSLDHNPGKTLIYCHTDLDPDVLESAAILQAVGNDVTIMSYTYADGSGKGVVKSQQQDGHGAPGQHLFDLDIVRCIRERLQQKGVRFVCCVPTKFERLREKAEGKAGILRVYAMGTSHGGPAEKGTGDWTPFLEEFNTAVIRIGKCVQLIHKLCLPKIGVQMSAESGRVLGRPEQSSVPNIYALGDALEQQSAPEELDCFEARQLLRRIYRGELDWVHRTELGRTLFLPPLEYSCCGLTELGAREEHGPELVNVYWDNDVPVPGAERAKLICTRAPEGDRVVGLHLLAKGASQLVQGYALAMQMGLTRAQMEALNRRQ